MKIFHNEKMKCVAVAITLLVICLATSCFYATIRPVSWNFEHKLHQGYNTFFMYEPDIVFFFTEKRSERELFGGSHIGDFPIAGVHTSRLHLGHHGQSMGVDYSYEFTYSNLLGKGEWTTNDHVITLTNQGNHIAIDGQRVEWKKDCVTIVEVRAGNIHHCQYFPKKDVYSLIGFPETAKEIQDCE